MPPQRPVSIRIGVLGRQSADDQPAERIAAARQQGQEAVAQQTTERQRHSEFLGSGQEQPDVLLPQGCRKAGRNKERLADRGRFWAPEHRRRHEALPASA